MALRELRLGTRGSRLALAQAHAVAARLVETGGPPPQIVTIATSGERFGEAQVSEAGGKRLFVKEIEEALQRGDIDLAVHSSKDLPADLPEGLIIGGVLPREDPLDVVVLPEQAQGPGLKAQGLGLRAEGLGLNAEDSELTDLMVKLGPSPLIGTGSVRRIAQLRRLFPDARFEAVRGNVETRLRKLDRGDYDLLVLAAAGLRRLGLASRISSRLSKSACVPAPGQGIVAVEIRSDDHPVRRVVGRFDDAETAAALEAERALVAALGAGCQVPLGALASPAGADELELTAVVVSLDGARAVRGHGHGPRREAAALGARVGAQMIAQGANEILADAQRSPQSPVPSPQSPVPSPQSPVPSPQSPVPSPQSDWRLETGD